MIQNVPAETERYDKFNENLSYLCYIYQKHQFPIRKQTCIPLSRASIVILLYTS